MCSSDLGSREEADPEVDAAIHEAAEDEKKF